MNEDARAGVVSLVLLSATAAGCGGCGDESGSAPAPSASTPLSFTPPVVSAERVGPPTLVAPPAALVFAAPATARREFNVPIGCAMRAEPLVAEVPRGTHLTQAVGRGVVVQGPTAADVPAPVGLFVFDEEARPAPPVPMPEARAFAYGEAGYSAFFTRGPDTDSAAVWWRSGESGGGIADSLGTGDGFRAVDAACTQNRCALLTSRLGKVLTAGAEVWIQPKGGESFEQWTIAPEGDEPLSPFGFARVDDEAVVVALERPGHAELWTVAAGRPPEKTAEVPAAGGLAGAVAWSGPTGPVELALARNRALEERCVPGMGLTLERPSHEAMPLRAPVQPEDVFARRVGKGALLAWLTPLGCEADAPSLRRVVYAGYFDERGELVGKVKSIAEGAELAVSSHDADVDLWLKKLDPVDESQASELWWARLTCSGEPR